MDRNFLRLLSIIGSYSVQNSVTRSTSFFLRNEFLLGCNHNLPNSLLYYELKCLGWIGVCGDGLGWSGFI